MAEGARVGFQSGAGGHWHLKVSRIGHLLREIKRKTLLMRDFETRGALAAENKFIHKLNGCPQVLTNRLRSKCCRVLPVGSVRMITVVSEPCAVAFRVYSGAKCPFFLNR